MMLACLAVLAAAATDSMLVSPAWLAARLDDPRVVIFHVGPRTEYDTAHIAGAQFIQLRDVAAPRDSLLPLELPAPEALDSTLEARGVADDSRIVLYWGSQWVSPTTRVYLTLVWAGLGSRVSILDGGLAAWRSAGHPITRDVQEPVRRGGGLTLRPRADVVVTADWVNARRTDPGVAIIDARASRFYTGEDTSYARPGHIAGAGTLPFTDVVDSAGRFLPRAALDSMLAAAGAAPGELVVTYCHIGQQATAVWFAARLLGREARLYDGSYTEWDRRTELPVERTTP